MCGENKESCSDAWFIPPPFEAETHSTGFTFAAPKLNWPQLFTKRS